MNKILCGSWQTGSANSIAPVIMKLLEDENLQLEVLAEDPATRVFSTKGIGFHEVQQLTLQDVNALINNSRYDLVLVGTSSLDLQHTNVLEQNITKVSRINNIPTLAVADIWARFAPVFGNETDSAKRFDYLPERVAVMNEASRQQMLKEGFPDSVIVVTGNPYFDDIVELKESWQNSDTERVRSDLGILQDKYVIMFASQPIELHYGSDISNPKFLGYTEKTALKELIDALSKIKHPASGITLLVKVHPREKQSDLEEITANTNLDIRFDGSYNVRHTILASNLVISPFSTVLYESSLLDKPSLSLQPGLVKEDMLPTNLWHITYPIYTREDIKPTLERAIHDSEFQRTLKTQRDTFSVEPNSTQRVVDLVYSMLY